MTKQFGLKWSAMVLGIALCFGSMLWMRLPVVAAGQDTEKYQEALEIMKTLDVLDENTEYDADAVICREDLAVYTAKLMGEHESDVECRYFIDVPAGSYGTWAINFLVERGAIDIDEERVFRPDDPAGADEAVKVITTVLGYEKFASANGGYPVGYRRAARAAELYTPEKETVGFCDFMLMLYSAIETELYEPVAYGSEVAMERTNSTLISVYHNMYQGQGTIEAVGEMSLLRSTGTEEGKIRIGGETYLLEVNFYAPEELGKYVKFFYTEERSGMRAVKIILSAEKKQDKRISIKDIEDFSETQISWFASNKHQSLGIGGSLWIYNGRPLEEKLAETLEGLNKGMITIRDSDGDGVYDVVLVWDFTNFVVKSINTQTNTLYNRLERGGSIERDGYETVRVFDEKKNAMDWDDIALGNVLSAAASADNRVLCVIVSNTEFNGTLSQVYSDPLHIVVNGETYEFDPSYEAEFKNMRASAGEIYQYKLDAFGTIAYIYSGESDSSMKLGYVIESAVSLGGMSERVLLRILCNDGTVSELELAERVKIDGRKISGAAAMTNAFYRGSAASKTIPPQMIRYEVNQAGEISIVDTLNLNSDYESEDNSLTVIGDEDFSIKWYMQNRFGMLAYLDNNKTTVFCIPKTPMSQWVDPLEYTAGTPGKFLRSDSCRYANIYTASGRSEFAEAVVYAYEYNRLDKNYIYSGIDVILVDEIVDAAEEDGTVVKCIKGMSGGSKVSVQLPLEVAVGDIGRGDLIQLRYGINGQIVPSYTAGEPDILTLYDYSVYGGSIPDNWEGNTSEVTLYEAVNNVAYHNYRAERQLSYGYVAEKSDSCIWWGYKTPTKIDEMFKISGVGIMVYDKSLRDDQQIYQGTIDDIEDYKTVGDACSSIILHTGVGFGRGLFVYK